MTADGREAPPGLVASVRQLFAHALALLATRGELAALELQDARDRVIRWALLALVAAALLMRTIRREAAVAPPLLAQTRAELAKDRAALRARPQPPADGS